MSDHYFSQTPGSAQDIREFTVELLGHSMRFRTDAGVFSKDDVDEGSRLLIHVLPCLPGDTLVDIGCGYGPIGLAAAKLVGEHGRVYMVDINQRAADLARHNAANNGLVNVEICVGDGLAALDLPCLDWAVTNPPIRAGKDVIRRLAAEGFTALKPGGSLLMVIRTKQGAKSMQTYLQGNLGPTEVVKKNSGFRVLRTQKL